MNMLFIIMFTIIISVVCIALIILLLASAIDFIEDTEFGKWLLQKIKSKWERE